ncbi:structural maintenance of chromosomes protein 5 isoform X2 [Anguilla anguilla]|uniref:structural maintenance of chromosomes protein 5 isoform X2 n=1 Tax=Anguilla anguilla TaxID=7936 RepID=UPI0015ADAC30|nr:structural maintenance of chromosomes protein 5 isoform X2 [Anguilla anguilla]
MAALGKRKRPADLFANSQTQNSRLNSSSNTQDDRHTAGDSNGSGFVEGSIVRITMDNFLSYSHSEVIPGPNLNMIVGPNGTGKSSIVCAICLGLAGKTAVLGRGDKVGLYVKRGCTKGWVEIELYRTAGNLVVRREIQVENNTSAWTINGRHATQKTVEEEVKALQVQVGNLCQFLPQEKVGEFAKMSKIELLEATEKSIGPPEMYEFHCKLKTFRTQEKEMENVCKEKASFLEKVTQRHERLRQDVERYYEKKRHLDTIKMLEYKRPWVEYETARQEMVGVKSNREEAKKKLKTLKESQAPVLRRIQALDGRLRPIENHMKEKGVAIREASQKCKQKQDQLDFKNKEIEEIQQAVRLKQTEEADRQKRIGNTRRLIEDLQAQLRGAEAQQDPAPQIDAVNAQLRRAQEERAQREGELSDLRREKDAQTGELMILKNKLRGLEDMMKRKEETLRGRFRDTYDALLWLRRNRQLFRGNVHEPMMLVINVKDPRHAKYIESHVPQNDLKAFVFQRQEDMEVFMTEVRDRQRLRVNAVIAPAESCANRPPPRPIQALQRFGFFSYLRELFDAPEDVMSYLCHQHRVNEIPVGTEKTKGMIETVIRESQLRILFTAEEKYTVRKSAYSSKTISSNSALRPSQFLSMTMDTEEKRLLEENLRSTERRLEEISTQMTALQDRLVQLDRHDHELRAQKKQLLEQKGRKRQLEQKISTKEDSLRQMEKGGIDLQRVEREAKEKIRAVNSRKVAIMAEFTHHMKLRARLQMDKVYYALESAQLAAEKSKLESESRECGAQLKDLERAVADLTQRTARLKQTCEGLLKKAKDACNMDQRDNVVPEHLHAAFNQLPNTLDEIDAQLNEERSRADCFTGLSDAVVEEHERKTQEIEQLRRELEEKKGNLESYRQSISQAKEKWLNPLKQLIEQINEKFSDFFHSMQCAGEVDLHSENEEEYDKYGIRIRVKFRSSMQLHELTPHHQSGGERSVSTMLYLMALQELNRCPFRVVDEINQGMDPVNERRVFDIVVRTACKGTTSQYFFITPKVLQNLSYADEMTVHCVHNGLQMLPPSKWNLESFIRRGKRKHKHMADQ